MRLTPWILAFLLLVPSNAYSAVGGLKTTDAGILRNGAALLTVPTSTDVLVGRATTDTLSNKTIAGLITTGGASVTNSSGPQATFSGWAPTPNASASNGAVYIGNTAANQGRMWYDAGSDAILKIDNTFDSAASAIKLRTRTSGTPIDALTVTGAATTVSNVLNVLGAANITGNLNITKPSGGTTTLLNAGITGVTNGFTITTDASNNISYTFLTKTQANALSLGSTGNLSTIGSLAFDGASGFSLPGGDGRAIIGVNATSDGLSLLGRGSARDFTLFNKNGSLVLVNPTGTVNLTASGDFAAAGNTSGATASVGTSSPAASAALEVASTTRGFLPPRVTTTQRDAISSPATGLTVYNTTLGSTQVYNGSSWQSVGSGGAGGGSKNYLSAVTASTASGVPNVGNGDLESGTAVGFSLGTVTLTSSMPSGVPSFGSGANGNLSISVASSGQLAGKYSLNYVSTVASTAGDFVATDPFFIDSSDQAKILQFKLSYSTIAATGAINFSGTSANTFGIAVYDVTNAEWIRPAGMFNLVQRSGVGIASGTFQTSLTGTQYRLVLYNANASPGSFSFRIDDASVGPQALVFGPAVSDVQNYTPVITAPVQNPTIGNGTLVGEWSRTGDKVRGRIRFLLGSTSGNGNGKYSFSLPGGLVADTSKMSLSSLNLNIVGKGSLVDTGNASWPIDVYYDAATNKLQALYTYVSGGSTQYLDLVGSSSPFSFGNTDELQINFEFPVLGWSSNTVMSNDTDTRVISWSGSQTSQAVTANVTNITFTTINDRSGAWNGTQFVVPVAGDYLLSGSGILLNPGTLQVFLNGVANGLFSTCGGAEASAGSILLTGLVPGDLVSLRSQGSTTVSSARLGVFRLSGPATIAASERVYMQYRQNNTQSLTANVTNIGWTIKEYDTHGAWNGSQFTAPKAGAYTFSGALNLSAAGNQAVFSYVNGVQKFAHNNNTSNSLKIFTGKLWLNAGDVLSFRCDLSGTTNPSDGLHWLTVYSQ